MSSLKRAIEKLITDTQVQLHQTTGVYPPESGVVTAVNDDGSVDVLTQSGLYTGIGNPNPDVTMGAQVLVITSSEGTRTTIPQ